MPCCKGPLTVPEPLIWLKGVRRSNLYYILNLNLSGEIVYCGIFRYVRYFFIESEEVRPSHRYHRKSLIGLICNKTQNFSVRSICALKMRNSPRVRCTVMVCTTLCAYFFPRFFSGLLRFFWQWPFPLTWRNSLVPWRQTTSSLPSSNNWTSASQMYLWKSGTIDARAFASIVALRTK